MPGFNEPPHRRRERMLLGVVVHGGCGAIDGGVQRHAPTSALASLSRAKVGLGAEEHLKRLGQRVFRLSRA